MTTTTTATPDMTSRLIESLNHCIELCLDGEKGYALAAANVRDETLKALFHKYAAEREGFVRSLRNAIELLGGYSENHGTARGSLHRALTDARLAMEGRREEVILGECERGDLGAVKAYDQIFARIPLDRMPTEVRAMLVEQRAAIQSAYDEVMREDLRRRSIAH